MSIQPTEERGGARKRRPRVNKLLLTLVILLCFSLFGSILARMIWGLDLIGTVLNVESRFEGIDLKDIGELATQVGYVSEVSLIDKRRQVFGVNIPLTQAKVIYTMTGEVRAGVDFTQVEVSVDGAAKKVNVSLPAARILSTTFDEDSLKVFDEQKNIFNPLQISDTTKAYAEMKRQAEQNAIDHGILQNARANAEVLIRGLLAGLKNYQSYDIAFEWG